MTADCLTQGKSYLEQVVNFAPQTIVDEKTGARKTLWGPRNGRVPVDFWDCEIYALAAAEMVIGELGWSREAWEQWKISAQPARQKVNREVVIEDEIASR